MFHPGAWVLGHPMNHRKPIIDHIFKIIALPSNYPLPVDPQLVVGTWHPFPSPCWVLYKLVLVKVITVAVDSFVRSSCHSQKTAFHRTTSNSCFVQCFLFSFEITYCHYHYKGTYIFALLCCSNFVLFSYHI